MPTLNVISLASIIVIACALNDNANGSKGDWILGKKGKTCNEVCSATGRVCNPDEQSSVTTNELVAQKMLEAGYTCKGYWKPREYPGTPFITEGKCAPIQSGKLSVCNGNKFGHHRALCYCEGEKKKYIMGAKGVDACPKGYKAIKDKKSCKKASEKLGLKYDKARNDNKPNAVCNWCNGCAPKVTRVSTNHGAGAKWICKKD